MMEDPGAPPAGPDTNMQGQRLQVRLPLFKCF